MARTRVMARRCYNRRRRQFQCNQNPNPNRNLESSGETSRKNIENGGVRNRDIKIKQLFPKSKNIQFRYRGVVLSEVTIRLK